MQGRSSNSPFSLAFLNFSPLQKPPKTTATRKKPPEQPQRLPRAKQPSTAHRAQLITTGELRSQSADNGRDNDLRSASPCHLYVTLKTTARSQFATLIPCNYLQIKLTSASQLRTVRS
jgi:hypothetical protein